MKFNLSNSAVQGLLLVGLALTASTASAFVISPTTSISKKVTSISLFGTPLNESSDTNGNNNDNGNANDNTDVDLGTSTDTDENIPLTIKERVANLMNIINENIINENDNQETSYNNRVLKKLPKPIFQSADEVTAYIRKYALETRAALGRSETWEPTEEKCNTFRLPEAATELFLHAETWYFFRGDENRCDGPWFIPKSQVTIASYVNSCNAGYFDDCNDCSPAWIEIGGAKALHVFQMCIDPESTEFGNIETWTDGGGPDSAHNLLNEKDHKNGERFLIYLEEYAQKFIVNGEEYDNFYVDLLTA